MRAKPIKALELIYPMIQLFIKKYFSVYDWLQSPGEFFITNCRWTYLKDVSNIPSIQWYNMIMIYHRSTSFLGAAA